MTQRIPQTDPHQNYLYARKFNKNIATIYEVIEYN